VKDVGTVRFLIERLFDGGNLPHDPADAIQQLLLFLYGVGHKRFLQESLQKGLYKDTPPGILCP
jgi:hypothetical protein